MEKKEEGFEKREKMLGNSENARGKCASGPPDSSLHVV